VGGSDGTADADADAGSSFAGVVLMPLFGWWGWRWAAVAPHLSARAADARLWNDEEVVRGARCPSAAALRSAEAALPSETILERDCESWEPLAILDHAIARAHGGRARRDDLA
jgi:hypothetical protein